MPDYSQYVAVKKIRTAQTANANTSIIKGRAPYMYDGYFPLYRSINLPVNALLSNKFTSGTGGAVAPTFIPTDIATLQLWLDAADSSAFTLSGSNITQWNDKSGKGRNASQFNTGFATYNGSNRVQITSTGQLSCSIPPGTFSGGVTGYVVFNSYGSNATDTLISRAVGAVAAPFDMYTYGSPVTTARLIGDGGTQFVSCDTATALFRTTSVTLYGFSIAANLVWNESVNGTSNTIAVSYNSGNVVYGDNGSSIVIGSRADKVTRASIYVYEIVLYNTALTTTERQQVEGYLAWKWGLQSNLPAGHAYKLAKP